jgi:putative transcriptional regulator
MSAGVLLLLGALVCPGQIRGPVKDLAAGRFLVAQRELVDPNFIRTVVLLAKYGEDGAMGLIINRPTKLPVSKVLDGLKGLKGRSEPAYLGGPVQVTGVLALVRSAAKLEESQKVLGDVYLVSSREVLEKTLEGGGALRVYLGYSGWAPGQLEAELELGSWYIFRGDPALVFDPEPETVWSRLIRGAEVRIARLRRPGR